MFFYSVSRGMNLMLSEANLEQRICALVASNNMILLRLSWRPVLSSLGTWVYLVF